MLQLLNLGSSPRMRGALWVDSTKTAVKRIIPADAGSTGLPSCTRWTGWDHPRGCGEHQCFRCIRFRLSGSSPRMRGALVGCELAVGGWGIIPADAGSTYEVRIVEEIEGDHPRGCGEHNMIRPRWLPGPGSSPRMRGALTAFHVLVTYRGIIPADAGSTVGPGWSS